MTMSLATPSHGYATIWGGRAPGSQTPGVPATPEPSTPNSCWPSRAEKWALTSSWTECEKMPQNAAKSPPPQHLNIPSMNESEAPPGTAGNLSLQDTATSTTVQELRLRHLHGFLHSLTLANLSYTTTGMHCAYRLCSPPSRRKCQNSTRCHRRLTHDVYPLSNQAYRIWKTTLPKKSNILYTSGEAGTEQRCQIPGSRRVINVQIPKSASRGNCVEFFQKATTSEACTCIHC